jgi:hypothetical protein
MKAGDFISKKIFDFPMMPNFRCPHSIKCGQFSRTVFDDVKTICESAEEDPCGG